MNIIFTLCLFSNQLIFSDNSDIPKTALILSSGSSQSPWAKAFENSIQEQFLEYEGLIIIQSEYLELGTFEKKHQIDLTLNYIEDKYKDRTPDFFITTGPEACYYTTMEKNLFPDSIKIGVNGLRSEEKLFDYTIGGGEQSILRTIDEIMRFSKSNHIYVVANKTESKINAERYDVLISLLKNKDLKYSSILNKSFTDLKSEVSKLPSQSAIYFLRNSYTRDGHTLTPKTVINELSKVSSVPIFSDSTITIGHGNVGGWVTSPTQLGYSISTFIKDYIMVRESTDPDSFGYEYVYDWTEAVRWELEDNIPENAILVNKPKSNIPINAILFILLILLLVIIHNVIIPKIIIKKNQKKMNNTTAEPSPFKVLSTREVEVLKRIYRGEQIKHIAHDLNISDRTVSTYKSRINKKLELTSHSDLIKFISKNEQYI